MPHMHREQARKAPTIQAGDITIEATTPVAGTQKSRRWETDAEAINIPAGAYEINIRHTDPRGGILAANGENLNYGDVYARSVREDKVANRQDFTPAIAIQNPDRVKITITVSYPSSSTVNPLAI